MALRGGSKLGPALKALQARLSSASSVRVGYLENQKYPDGTSLAMVAAIQDFGATTRKIPPRPFFRNMIAKEKNGWGPTTKKLLVASSYDAKKTLTLLGQYVAEQLQESILETNSPPLSPKTIAAKSAGMTGKQKASLKKLGVMGPEKPLVASGLLLRSPTYEVK